MAEYEIRSKKEHIAFYLECGLSLIPIVPHSKKPLIPWLPHQRVRATPDQVRDCLQRYPSANIAAVMGDVSGGIIAIDIDPRNGGLESMKRLELPDTLTVATGGGGFHYFYRSNGPIGKKIGILPGVDLIANGGYCVLPPSIHQSGQPYKILKNLPIAPAPDWIYTPDRKTANSIIPVGHRHASILRSIRGYAADTKFSFILLWKRACGLVVKCADLPPEAPFTIGELFDMCLWSWNETHPHDRKTHAQAWGILSGHAKNTGDIVFGPRTALIPNSFHLKNVNTSTTQHHNISESNAINIDEIEIPIEEIK